MNNIEIDINDYFELTPRKYTRDEVMEYARSYMNQFDTMLSEAVKTYSLKSKFPKGPLMNWDRNQVLTAMSSIGFTFVFDYGTKKLVDCYRLPENCGDDEFE